MSCCSENNAFKMVYNRMKMLNSKQLFIWSQWVLNLSKLKITECMTNKAVAFKMANECWGKKAQYEGRVTEVFRLTLNYTC